MNKIDIFNNIIKNFFINLSIFYIFIRSIDYKHISIYKIISIILMCSILSFNYNILSYYISPIIFSPILYLAYSITLSWLMKQKVEKTIIIVMISFAISYVLYLISSVIAGMILYMFNISYNNSLCIIVIIIIDILLILTFFRIKRFKNGIYCFKSPDKIEKLITASILIFGIVLIIHSIANATNSWEMNSCLVAGVIFTAVSIIIWLKNQTTKMYKKNMRDRTISVQKAEIDEQTKLLEEVKAENLKLATAVHKYNHRLSSLELAMKSAISHNLNTEFADELSVMLKDTENLSNSFAKECDVVKCILPLTNVPSIDNMFKYMQDEASKCNINFDLKINESINDLIDNIIPKDMFETLLGDHLRDAIIAVNASDNSYKSILTTLGLVDGCYELSIYDTGIEFQIDTLLKLGKEQVTTHKDSGGSGIGFITTFETLKTTKASLVIEEYNPETTNYTKSVSIRFDGKNQYRIYSYRADDIKKQNKEKRIIVKNIE